MNETKHVMSIAIGDKEHDRIKRESRYQRVSQSEFVRRAVAKYFQLLESNKDSAPVK